MALANIYNQLNLQAGVQGYQDVYMELSYMSIFLVFLAFLLSKNRPGQGPGGGAMHYRTIANAFVCREMPGFTR
jgi:DHA2 family multidrug resistance protein